MNKKQILIKLIMVPTFLFAQTYSEWIGNGWGSGINDAHPVVVDLDSDGLYDLLVGTYDGNISHFEQIAINDHYFQLIKHQLSGIDVGIYGAPACSDIDKDGLLDLIIGAYQGNLHHYEQVSTNADTFYLVSEDFNNIKVGSVASPHFTDFDHDELLDLIIGAHSGNLFHYEQEITGSTNFNLITDSMNVDPGTIRINPTVVDLDEDGLLDLIIGGNNGRLSHYEQDSLGSLDFILESSDMIDFHEYIYGGTTPCIVDFDSDGLLDLLVGEMDGLYYHFEQTTWHSTEFNIQSSNFLETMDVGAGAAPCVADFDNDGLLDLIVGEWHGNLNHFEQIATGSLDFTLVTDSLGDIVIGQYSLPSLTDLDGDNLLDLIVGERDGILNHFEQDAGDREKFNLVTENFNGVDVERFASPFFTDLDGDYLIDMIVGEANGKLYLYEQQSMGAEIFDLISDSLNAYSEGYQPAPYVIDYDSDGLLDLLVGDDRGMIYHYEQEAEGSIDFVLISDKFEEIKVQDDARIALCDINLDGLRDIIVGEQRGGLRLYLNQTAVNVELHQTDLQKPHKFQLHTNYPNPFNLSTMIKYSIPKQSNVFLKVFDVLGSEVSTLVDKGQPQGHYEVEFDVSDLTSGIYFYRLQAGDYLETKKMILLK